MLALAVLVHHSEPSDPRLLRWVIDTLEPVLGLGPGIVVIPVALFVTAFPIVLAILALRSQRGHPNVDVTDGDGDGRFAR